MRNHSGLREGGEVKENEGAKRKYHGYTLKGNER
jgi:hypothetical protein